MRISTGSMALAIVLSLGASGAYAASGLPETSPGLSGQSSGAAPSGDQQQLEKQRREEGVGTSGNLPMQDKGMRPENPPAEPSKSGKVKDEQIMMGSQVPVIEGEVLRIEGEKYTVKDSSGTEVHLVVNQNTRMDCGPGAGAISSFQPREQTATDQPLSQGEQRQGQGDQQGKLQDLSRTNEQPGSDVGKSQNIGATSSAGSQATCAFTAGDKIKAEVSDMGAATMIKKVSSDKTKDMSDKGAGSGSRQ
jgi:hypothetical protein